MQACRRISFRAFGDPIERAEIETYVPPVPAAGEVQVRLLYAPINPADFNYLEGTYGLKPEASADHL